MSPARLPRRTTVALGGLTVLGACASPRRDDAPPVTGSDRDPGRLRARRLTYGDHPSQWAELTLPDGGPRGVVVVLHGGFWRQQYGAELGAPLAADLVGRGWATLNVEYRRVGGGGGVPQTLDDVAAALDLLAGQDVDLATVVTLGHSAGGQLATWAAARGRLERWAGGVEVTHVVSQSGVLDLAGGVEAGLGAGAIEDFVGGPPSTAPRAYELADPTQQVPLDQPVWCVHAPDDDVVPVGQSTDYVERAQADGGDATFVEVDGGHFEVIDPASDAWASVVEVLDEIG